MANLGEKWLTLTGCPPIPSSLGCVAVASSVAGGLMTSTISPLLIGKPDESSPSLSCRQEQQEEQRPSVFKLNTLLSIWLHTVGEIKQIST
jgi:hypothetical protein